VIEPNRVGGGVNCAYESQYASNIVQNTVSNRQAAQSLP
jgi:hypothetical protein